MIPLLAAWVPVFVTELVNLQAVVELLPGLVAVLAPEPMAALAAALEAEWVRELAPAWPMVLALVAEWAA